MRKHFVSAWVLGQRRSGSYKEVIDSWGAVQNAKTICVLFARRPGCCAGRLPVGDRGRFRDYVRGDGARALLTYPRQAPLGIHAVVDRFERFWIKQA